MSPVSGGSGDEHSHFDSDWESYRLLAHRAIDEMVSHLSSLSEMPAWQEMPPPVVERLKVGPIPRVGVGESRAYEAFVQDILPYPNGNLHPRFFGWVQGPGMRLANLADYLASAMNPHLAGFNQAPALVEAQVLHWMKEIMGFPPSSSGVLESGGTMGNILGLAVARHVKSGFDVRQEGLQGGHPPVTVYCSEETHGWVRKGAELLGIGSSFVRFIPANREFQVDLQQLEDAVIHDLQDGLRPVCIIGTAGTVNTGATDDLCALAGLCRRHDLWFHVDGAFGAFARLAPSVAQQVEGIQLADSLTFDLHKWMYLPFEIACTLIRDAQAHVSTFEMAPSYIASLNRGTIAGGLPFFDRGVDLTRGFKALKAWMCISAYGLDSFGAAIERNLDQARLLCKLVDEHPNLERLAPAPLNIVCFRYVRAGLNESELDLINQEILFSLQEKGIAVPSSTQIDGKFSLRACLLNHRTTFDDVRMLIDASVQIGGEVCETAQVTRRVD